MQRFPFGKNYKEEKENIKYRKKCYVLLTLLMDWRADRRGKHRGNRNVEKERHFL